MNTQYCEYAILLIPQYYYTQYYPLIKFLFTILPRYKEINDVVEKLKSEIMNIGGQALKDLERTVQEGMIVVFSRRKEGLHLEKTLQEGMIVVFSRKKEGLHLGKTVQEGMDYYFYEDGAGRYGSVLCCVIVVFSRKRSLRRRCRMVWMCCVIAVF
jgi:hypothetical protein